MGVLDVLFCHSRVHLGRLEVKNEARWCCAAVCPGVPGTRGMSSGARRDPDLGSMSSPGEGMARRKLSERGLYARVGGSVERHSRVLRREKGRSVRMRMVYGR